MIVSPYEADQVKVEATLVGMLAAFDAQQGEVCSDRLNHAKVRKGTRHWEGEDKAIRTPRPLDSGYVVESMRWAQQVRDSFSNMLNPVIRREVRNAAKDARVAVNSTRVRMMADDVMDQIGKIVEESVMNQSRRLADKVRTMDAEGKPLKEIQEAVRDMAGDRSQWRKALSQNMAGAAFEGARAAVYEQVPGKVTKTWNAHHDEKVRASHQKADGDTVKASGRFRVGSAMMRYPHDPTGPVEEVANCRCWLTWQVT